MCEQNTLIQFAKEFIEQKGLQIISYKLVNYKASSINTSLTLDVNTGSKKYYLGTLTGTLSCGDDVNKSSNLNVIDVHGGGNTIIDGKTFSDSGLVNLPFQLFDTFFTHATISTGSSQTASSSLSFVGYEFKLAL